MTACCPLVDGSSGGGPTPPPTPVCANTVLVQDVSDFPAPVGDEIFLDADTLYRICGGVDVSPLTVRLQSSTVLAGEDPLVDSLRSTVEGPAVYLPEGGTVKDLSIAQIRPVRPLTGSAIQICEVGGVIVDAAVVFNVAVRGAASAIRVAGRARMISIARVTSMGSPVAVLLDGDLANPAQVEQISIDQAVVANPGDQVQGVVVTDQTSVSSMSVSLMVVNATTAGDFGIRTGLLGLITTLRVSSCAYFGPGTPSEISQGPPLPFGTTGTARNSEAVGCVGFTNSRTRAAAQIANATTPNTGALTPIGTPAGPTYLLSPGTSRFRLDGLTGPSQSLEYTGFAPADVTVTGYLSVQVASGFSVVPRVVVFAIFVDRDDGLGFVQVGLPFAATTPNFSSAAPCFVAVSEGISIEQGYKLQLRLLNSTDADPLFVLAARIVIGEE